MIDVLRSIFLANHCFKRLIILFLMFYLEVSRCFGFPMLQHLVLPIVVVVVKVCVNDILFKEEFNKYEKLRNALGIFIVELLLAKSVSCCC
jgi:hypothetical protein